MVTMPKHVGDNRRIYRLWNCAFVGVNKVLMYRNAQNELRKSHNK